jgi:hypothetical protein
VALPVPKPDLRQVVATIHELTRLLRADLEKHVGELDMRAELILQQGIARAVDYGINAQRDAFFSAPELLPTPILPPPEPPATEKLPPPPKLPKGI